jgi:hypothetical protein
MKTIKNPNRIASELLETALALRKHNVLSAQELSKVKNLMQTPSARKTSKQLLSGRATPR